MSNYPNLLNDLIKEFELFPSIGPKVAKRMAMYLLTLPIQKVNEFSNNIKYFREAIKECDICYSYSTTSLCSICSNSKRDETKLIVVSNNSDLFSLEKTSTFNGKYHVLGGILNPIKNIGVESLNIDSLVDRVGEGQIKEITFALSSSVESEATIQYLKTKLSKFEGISFYSLARGIPVGGDLEYLSNSTITSSFENRVEIV